MHTLYTTGYRAGWTPATLRCEADRLGALVLDIRMNPTSIRAEWTKRALHKILGDRYRHIPQLGNRNYQGGPIALAAPWQGVDVVQLVLAEQPAILLCACPQAATCHRTSAAQLCAQRLGCATEELPAPAPVSPAGTIKALTLYVHQLGGGQ